MSDAAAHKELPVPYRAIARLLEQRGITLFLGAASSLVAAQPTPLPSGAELTRDLSRLASYPGSTSDPLTKVSQYAVEFAGDRDLILGYIKSRFHEDIPGDYRCAFTDFLDQIPEKSIPRLIVSTNYDTLVERLFERKGVAYICISHVLGRSKYAGRLIAYDKLSAFSKDSIMTRVDAEEMLLERLSEDKTQQQPVIIYKMHGSAISYIPRKDRDGSFGQGLNSIVLTEQDYIDFLDRNTTQRLPIQVQKMLYQSQFLFLGYSLADWNFRLLLHRLRESQAGADTKHWACLRTRDLVESVFWQKRGVNIHHVSLDEFLVELKRILNEEA